MDYLQGLKKENGQRRFGDRTINRILAHMKTFAKWIHKLRPFPLGNPMEKIRTLITGSTLEIEKALTPSERRRLLDSVDRLLMVGGRSRNRRLAKREFEKRPRRKGYRPYRNRAVIYTLIETGMRRAAVCNIDLDDVDFQKRMLPAQEKGGIYLTYRISKEGMDAIRDHLDHEREQDNGRWHSPALFLPAGTVVQAAGRLGVRTVNNIWNAVCRYAGVEGGTCHSAHHAIGNYLMEKTENVAAVQKQLGHKNAAYSMQYARITGDELLEAYDSLHDCAPKSLSSVRAIGPGEDLCRVRPNLPFQETPHV